MSLTGNNPGPVSAAGFGRQAYNPPYYADSLGQISYNPYMGNQVPYRHTNPGPSDSSRMHNFSLPSVTGTGPPFFGHGPQDSMGSSEPLLGAFTDSEPEPPVPPVPPRNPQRPVGGSGGPTRGDGGVRDNRVVLNGGSSVYTDDDVAYGGLRRGSLRVRLEVVDSICRSRFISGSKYPGLVLTRSVKCHMPWQASLWTDCLTIH